MQAIGTKMNIIMSFKYLKTYLKLQMKTNNLFKKDKN